MHLMQRNLFGGANISASTFPLLIARGRRLAPRRRIPYHWPMTDKPPDKPRPAMIGLPPSARSGRPADTGLHASQIAQEWEDVGERYVRRRMKELGIPEHERGQPDYAGDGRWRAFDPYAREGGDNTTGVVVNSGVLNPELLKGKKGGRIWPRMRLKDRIDAIIAHEYEELHHDGSHVAALKAAPKTELPISDEARRVCRAMAK
jgi:hypothetical protein